MASSEEIEVSEDDNTNDDLELITLTQATREYVKLIEGNFGSLPKADFTKSFLNEYDIDDIAEARREMYELCRSEIQGTPVGELIVRKDCGGKSVGEKLADDVYVLYHYMKGDKSMAVEDILNVKSRKAWKMSESQNGSNGSENVTVCDPISKNVAPSTPRTGRLSQNKHSANNMNSITLEPNVIDLVQTLVMELRKDRELMINDIVQLKIQVSKVDMIYNDVTNMKQQLNQLGERITHIEQDNKSLDKKMVIKFKDDREQSTATTKLIDSNSNNIMNVRQMYSATNDRINKIELHMNSVKYRNPSEVIPVRITSQSRPLPQSNMQPPPAYHTQPDDTTAVTVMDTPTVNSPSPRTKRKSTSLSNNLGPISVKTPQDVELVPQSTMPTQRPPEQTIPKQVISNPDQQSSSNTDLILEGFTTVKHSKPKYAAYYVGGVITKMSD